MTSKLAMPWGFQYKQAGLSGRKRLHPMSMRLLLTHISWLCVYNPKLWNNMFRGAAVTEASRSYKQQKKTNKKLRYCNIQAYIE